MVIKSFTNEEAVCDKLKEFQRENYHIRVKRNTVSNLANTLPVSYTHLTLPTKA